jgi:hypothetical protein
MENSSMLVSAEYLGRVLFDHVVLDPSFHDSAITQLKDEIDPEVARRELMYVTIFAIDFNLMRSPAILESYGENARAVMHQFVGCNKERAQVAGLDEDEYLDSLEQRLFAYNQAIDAWRDGHAMEKAGKTRPPESFYSLAFAFCGFCGTRVTNPITIVLLDHHFHSLIVHTAEFLKKYKIA